MEVSNIIETQKLTKVFKGLFSKQKTRAVDGVDLTIKKGEIFGFLGPNGSGKTTTMKLLLGLLFPTSGQAFVLGKNPTDITVKEKIGFLPEETYLYKFLSAEEILDFYAQIFNIPKTIRKRKIVELLELVDLQKEVWKRPIKEYSKGMARRVGLAQALINDPELVFLDEPTSGLDPIMTRQVKDLILDLKNQGKTVFLSSHLLSDIEDVCDRIGIMHKGKLKKVGKIKELISIKEKYKLLIEGLDEQGVEDLTKTIDEKGGKVIEAGHPAETLESLFLKTIDSNEKNSDNSTTNV